MLFTFFLSLSVHAASTLPPFHVPTSAQERAEAIQEYKYARNRWMHDRLIRSFVVGDHTQRIWGDAEAKGGPIAPWGEAVHFEWTIAAAADQLIRLELEMAEKYKLQPSKVWASFYNFEGTEHRLGPRPAQASLEYLNEVADRVGEISPSLKNWLVFHVTSRWQVFAQWNLAAEDVAAWRRRVWQKSQLYDHHRVTPEELRLYAKEMGPDPTESLVALEADARARFALTEEQSHEYVHRLLHSWQEHPWSSLHRPPRFGPPPEGYNRMMLDGIKIINRLAFVRLGRRLQENEDASRKYVLGNSIPPWAITLAEAELKRDLAKRNIDDAIVGKFYKEKIKLEASREPYAPVPLDPAVAENLGARLVHARRAYGCSNRLER